MPKARLACGSPAWSEAREEVAMLLLPPSDGPTQVGATPVGVYFRAVMQLSDDVEINVGSSRAAVVSANSIDLVVVRGLPPHRVALLLLLKRT